MQIGIRWVGLIGIAIGGAAAGVSFTQRGRDVSSGAARTGTRDAEVIVALQRDLREMKAEMATTRLRLARAEASAAEGPSQETEASIVEPPADDDSSRGNTVTARTPAERDELLVDLSRALFEDALQAESRDAQWAPRREEEIRSAIAENYKSHLTSVQCGSTLCRTVVDHGTEEDRRPFLDRLVSDATFGPSFFFMPLEQGIGTEIFSAREGQSLPRVDPQLLR